MPSHRFAPGNEDWKKAQKKGAPKQPKSYELQKVLLEELTSEPDLDEAERAELGEGNNFQLYVRKVMLLARKGNREAMRLLSEWTDSEGFIEKFEEYERRGMARDMSFLRYQIYERAHKIQQMMLLDPSKYIGIMAGRQSGKTEFMKQKAAIILGTIPESSVLYIGLTIETSIKLMYDGVIDYLKILGIYPDKENRTNGEVKFANGSMLHIKGNASIDECEKLRGPNHNLVIIDECQSQEKRLKYLVRDIIEPELAKRNGHLIMCGTAPRVPGTFWEEYSTDPNVSHYHFTISDNPFIPNHTEVLEAVLKEHGWTPSNSTFKREWLGEIMYDEDALVYRLRAPNNYFNNDQLKEWIKSQPPSDIGFVGGLDWGYEDFTSFVICVYSVMKPERFVIYELKENRKDITNYGNKIKKAIEDLKANPLFLEVPRERFNFVIWADPAGGMKTANAELSHQWNLNVQSAVKTDVNLGIEQLQDWFQRDWIKVIPDGIVHEEARRIVFKKDEATEYYTREIDDNVYHPEILMALLYSFRTQMKYRTDFKAIQKIADDNKLSPAEKMQRDLLAASAQIALENKKRMDIYNADKADKAALQDRERLPVAGV